MTSNPRCRSRVPSRSAPLLSYRGYHFFEEDPYAADGGKPAGVVDLRRAGLTVPEEVPRVMPWKGSPYRCSRVEDCVWMSTVGAPTGASAGRGSETASDSLLPNNQTVASRREYVARIRRRMRIRAVPCDRALHDIENFISLHTVHTLPESFKDCILQAPRIASGFSRGGTAGRGSFSLHDISLKTVDFRVFSDGVVSPPAPTFVGGDGLLPDGVARSCSRESTGSSGSVRRGASRDAPLNSATCAGSGRGLPRGRFPRLKSVGALRMMGRFFVGSCRHLRISFLTTHARTPRKRGED
jgi:hypothetical protein